MPRDGAPPAIAAQDSYVVDGGVFVRDNLAVLPGGVAMRDSTRSFVVEPTALSHMEVLGRGASSYVQRAVHNPTGTQLALKVLSVYDKSMRAQLTKEIQTLYDADCDCVLTFYGAFYKEGCIYIALEYMDVGTLAKVISTVGRVPEPVLAGMAYQMLWALAYMRVEKRLHRDIKPSNVLVNSRGHVKLSDFGLSTELKHSLGMAATFTGTCRYMSPERIVHQAYGFSADIWSFGLVLFEAAIGAYPYPECATYIEMAETIVESPEPRLPASAGFSPEFVQFVHSCLQRDPALRLPADILLGSPWFAQHGVRDVESACEVVRTWIAHWNASVAAAAITQSSPATLAATPGLPVAAGIPVAGAAHAAAAAREALQQYQDTEMLDQSPAAPPSSVVRGASVGFTSDTLI